MLFLTLIILVTIVILLFLKDERAVQLKGETFYVMNIQYFFSF
jgi:hypothetical protein